MRNCVDIFREKKALFEIIVNPIIRKSNAFIPENSSKSSYVICAVSPSLLLDLSNNFFVAR